MNNKVRYAKYKTEIKLFERYLAVGEPYGCLKCTIESSKNEIEIKYKELSRKYMNNRDKKEKVYNAYKILSNDRLRELYDAYVYKTYKIDDKGNESFDLGQVPLDNSDEVEESVALIILILLTNPIEKVALISNSSITPISSIKVVKKVLNQGIKGLYRNTVFRIVYGVPSSFVFETIKKYIKSTESKSKLLYHVLNNTVIGFLKHPQSLIYDLMDIAPISLSIYDIIFNVVLRKQYNSSQLQWKNLFYFGTSGLALWCIKTNIERFFKFFKNYSNENSRSNRLLKYSCYLMNNIYTYSAIKTVCLLPFQIIRAQYPRILLESYLNSDSFSSLVVPVAVNPISMAISIYKLNNNSFSRFFSGFLPYYVEVLLNVISDNYDKEHLD